MREHFQRRDRLRLVIGYRRKYLESLVRQGEEEVRCNGFLDQHLVSWWS